MFVKKKKKKKIRSQRIDPWGPAVREALRAHQQTTGRRRQLVRGEEGEKNQGRRRQASWRCWRKVF